MNGRANEFPLVFVDDHDFIQPRDVDSDTIVLYPIVVNGVTSGPEVTFVLSLVASDLQNISVVFIQSENPVSSIPFETSESECALLIGSDKYFDIILSRR